MIVVSLFVVKTAILHSFTLNARGLFVFIYLFVFIFFICIIFIYFVFYKRERATSGVLRKNRDNEPQSAEENSNRIVVDSS